MACWKMNGLKRCLRTGFNLHTPFLNRQGGRGGVNDGFEMYQASDIHIPEIENRFDKKQRFLIAGAGKMGQETAKALRYAQYDVAGFLDNNRDLVGRDLDGVKIYPFEYINDEQDYVIVIANLMYGREFYRQIRGYQYPEDKILFCLDGGGLVVKFGDEYFDVPVHEKGKKEVFIDAGSLDGEDSNRFIRWCGGEYEKIIAIEPSERSSETARRRIPKGRASVFNLAIGDRKGWVDFFDIYGSPESSGLHRKPNSFQYKVPIDKIDNLARDQKVTFIKMDIEGGEMAALKGAIRTIQRDKPVLALSVYHNEDDLIDIPLFVDTIRSDYKYYLRHYSNSICDLVLYCL